MVPKCNGRTRVSLASVARDPAASGDADAGPIRVHPWTSVLDLDWDYGMTTSVAELAGYVIATFPGSVIFSGAWATSEVGVAEEKR
jgi:hypothetical protein